MKYLKLSPNILFIILSYFLFWKINNFQNTQELQSVLLAQDLPKLELEYVDGKFLLNNLLGKKPFIINISITSIRYYRNYTCISRRSTYA